MKVVQLIIVITILCSLSSCENESDFGGYRTSDKEYTKMLLEQLDKEDINYTVDKEGFIYYRDKEKFNQAQEYVDYVLGPGSRVSINNDTYEDSLKSVLVKYDLEFFVLNYEGEKSIKWFPKNKEQSKNIIMESIELDLSKLSRKDSDCDKKQKINDSSKLLNKKIRFSGSC